MYLKEIFADGFKSFAHPTRITFTKGITGVIGPNGSGKSNISDAVKWVLGETSKKTLRSHSNNDFIFEGSQTAEQSDRAIVKILFDNSDRKLNLDYNEIEIARKIYRDSSENEYSINGERVRLKDIKNLITGSGLGKGSIANISQGSINNFIESKPEDRRLLFDEAAGVSQFKFKKNDALKNLEKTRDNLKNIEAIKVEKEKRLPYLNKQAEKAKRYLIFKNELDKIELIFIANKITIINAEKAKFINNKKTLEESLVQEIANSTSLSTEKIELTTNKQIIQDNIYKLEDEKVKIDREIQSNDQSNLVAGDKKMDPKELQSSIVQLEQQKKITKKEIEKLEIEEKDKNKELKIINSNYVSIDSKLFYKNTAIIKIKENIKNAKNDVENLSYSSPGNKTIIQNKKFLSGIIDVFENLIEIRQEHSKALYESSGNVLKNIIVNTMDDARDAILFLKSNQAGFATFVPLYELDMSRKKSISDHYLIALESQKGYVNVLANLLKFNSKYKDLIWYYFGTTIIIDNIDHAVKISKFIDKKYKIVTLDGDIIMPGGILSGGYKTSIHKNNKFYLQSKIKNHENTLIEYDKEYIILNEAKNKIWKELEIIQEEKENNSRSIYQFNNNISLINDKINLNQQTYKNITGSEFTIDSKEFKLTNKEKRISELKIQKDKLVINIQMLREKEHNINEKINDLEITNEQLKGIQIDYNNKLSKIERQLTVYKIEVNNFVEKLSNNYSMTEEYCLQKYFTKLENISETETRVKELNFELTQIGNVDLDSISEYEQQSQEYDILVTQIDDIRHSEEKLLIAIQEIDQIVIEKFSKLIIDVNEHLPVTFKNLFGDGTAKILYTNDDNILESGVEIIAKPPGKKITNLNLLSGGEKALITLCVLFTILKVRPTPLSILDEAEAALDVSNVVKFAKYMKNFTDTTQFIVITHRPGTMEHCEKLYGATMQEKGITDIFSISFKDADQYSNEKRS